MTRNAASNARQRLHALAWAARAPAGQRAPAAALALLPRAWHHRFTTAWAQLPPHAPANWNQGASMPPAHLPPAPRRPGSHIAEAMFWGVLATAATGAATGAAIVQVDGQPGAWLALAATLTGLTVLGLVTRRAFKKIGQAQEHHSRWPR
jgi:hypothetical protein